MVKRIGMDLFTSRLGELCRLEAHGRAAKQPQLRARSPADLLLDYEFCALYKLTEGTVHPVNRIGTSAFEYILISSVAIQLVLLELSSRR